MGLNNSSNVIYLSVNDGKIVRRVKEDTPGAVRRVTKENKEVYELKYDSVSGYLKDILFKDSDFGRQMNVFLDDAGQTYCLGMSMDSGSGFAFLKTIKNAQLLEQIELIPFQKVENGQNRSLMFVKQNGVSLKFYYTKDHPNGLPPAREVLFKGKKTWDFYEQRIFLEQMVENEIRPKLPGAKRAESASLIATRPATPELASDWDMSRLPEEDDLPF